MGGRLHKTINIRHTNLAKRWEGGLCSNFVSIILRTICSNFSICNWYRFTFYSCQTPRKMFKWLKLNLLHFESSLHWIYSTDFHCPQRWLSYERSYAKNIVPLISLSMCVVRIELNCAIYIRNILSRHLIASGKGETDRRVNFRQIGKWFMHKICRNNSKFVRQFFKILVGSRLSMFTLHMKH